MRYFLSSDTKSDPGENNIGDKERRRSHLCSASARTSDADQTTDIRQRVSTLMIRTFSSYFEEKIAIDREGIFPYFPCYQPVDMSLTSTGVYITEKIN